MTLSCHLPWLTNLNSFYFVICKWTVTFIKIYTFKGCGKNNSFYSYVKVLYHFEKNGDNNVNNDHSYYTAIPYLGKESRKFALYITKLIKIKLGKKMTPIYKTFKIDIFN